MKKHRFLTLILPVITIILEILPFGAVCNFALDGGKTVRKLYSYFSLTPYGYANFAPFLCAILSCILLVLCIIYTVKGHEPMLKNMSIISACVTVISLFPLLYGIRFFSVLGAFISLTLALQTAFCFYLYKKH